MSIKIHATYKDGVLLLDGPLPLPEGAELDVTVTLDEGQPAASIGKAAIAPKPAKISSEEFLARVKKYAVGVGSLPVDFSRADIYRDHD